MQVGKAYAPYLRNFLKKLIVEVESIHGEVLDEIYELYADIITSLKVKLLMDLSYLIFVFLVMHIYCLTIFVFAFVGRSVC